MIRRLESIMLVEDDPITNFLNERIVKKLDVTNTIQIANNGLEAIQYLEELKDHSKPLPELIFLDINMPVMDGLEFLEKYKELNTKSHANVIIVMLTSSTHIKDMESLLRFDNIDFLSKPFTEDKLVSIINKYFAVAPYSQTA